METNPRSDVGYVGDYNLVFPGVYIPIAITGAHDVNLEARFLSATDYRLATSSPAIDAGNNLESQEAGLSASLRNRTTTGFGPDSGDLDIGYHF